MKREIKDIIFGKAQSDEKNIFKNYGDKKVIGKKIFDALWGTRRKFDPEWNIARFFDSEKNATFGYLTDIYGVSTILELYGRLNVNIEKEKAEVFTYVTKILDAIATNKCWGILPYVDIATDRILFSERKRYIGNLTWTLSFLTSVRKLLSNGYFKFDSQENAKKYNEIIKKTIYNIVYYFCQESYIDTPGEYGWGYTSECEHPSLFFTYSVLEAYSDFEDNVLLNEGEPRDILEELLSDEVADREIFDYLQGGGIPLITKWREQCSTVSNNIYSVYKNIIGRNMVNDNFLVNINTVSKEEILKFNSTNALFNNVFIVFSLIYGYANRRKENEGVVSLMDYVLQDTQRLLKELEDAGKDYIVDTYNVLFNEKRADEVSSSYARMLNSENIVASTLTPILVKANNLLARYVMQYPVKRMGQLFESIFENMLTNDDWLWETTNYRVIVTERYVEAIADFYDYYEEYEADYLAQKLDKQKIRNDAEQSVQAKVRKANEKAMNEAIRKAREEAYEAAKKSFVLENLLDEKIKTATKEQIEILVKENFIKYLSAHYKSRYESQASGEDSSKKKTKSIEEYFDGLFDFLADSWNSEITLNWGELLGIKKK